MAAQLVEKVVYVDMKALEEEAALGRSPSAEHNFWLSLRSLGKRG